MPFLREEDVRRLVGFHDSAEYELDLRGLDGVHALASVERMIERSRFRPPRRVVILIDRPNATSGETPFRPIGRLLIAGMKTGTISRCRPLPEAGAGFWIDLAGNPGAKLPDGNDRG